MSKLAVWSIADQSSDSAAEPVEPKRAGRSTLGLEKWLEDWIVKDVSLIGEGLTLVGRQVKIDDGVLDLLAIDSKERWVVIEEPVERPRPERKHTVEAVRKLAREAGVVEQLDRFMEMADQAGLAVQPQMTSIRIAPTKDKRRLLLYVEPMPDAKSAGNGKLHFYWAPDALKKYYGIDEQEVEAGLGKLDDDRAAGGDRLEERLNQIQRFLTKHFPDADTNET